MHVSVCSTAVDTNVHASWHKFEGAAILHATRNPIVCYEGRQAQAHLSHPADAAGINISCPRPNVQWARTWSNAGSARSWFCGVGSGRKLLPSGAGDAQHQVKFDQIGPGRTKLRESKLISTESQRVRPWTHTRHSQQLGMLGILLLDLGGSLGPYCKPQRMQWIISLVLVGHVILTLFRLICNLKLRIARKRGPLPR